VIRRSTELARADDGQLLVVHVQIADGLTHPSVVKEPELLSRTYRNRVRNLSPGNRNSGVQHLPGPHSQYGAILLPARRFEDQKGLTVLDDQASDLDLLVAEAGFEPATSGL
jgi:hypothetical protein